MTDVDARMDLVAADLRHIEEGGADGQTVEIDRRDAVILASSEYPDPAAFPFSDVDCARKEVLSRLWGAMKANFQGVIGCRLCHGMFECSVGYSIHVECDRCALVSRRRFDVNVAVSGPGIMRNIHAPGVSPVRAAFDNSVLSAQAEDAHTGGIFPAGYGFVPRGGSQSDNSCRVVDPAAIILDGNAYPVVERNSADIDAARTGAASVLQEFVHDVAERSVEKPRDLADRFMAYGRSDRGVVHGIPPFRISSSTTLPLFFSGFSRRRLKRARSVRRPWRREARRSARALLARSAICSRGGDAASALRGQTQSFGPPRGSVCAAASYA